MGWGQWTIRRVKDSIVDGVAMNGLDLELLWPLLSILWPWSSCWPPNVATARDLYGCVIVVLDPTYRDLHRAFKVRWFRSCFTSSTLPVSFQARWAGIRTVISRVLVHHFIQYTTLGNHQWICKYGKIRKMHLEAFRTQDYFVRQCVGLGHASWECECMVTYFQKSELRPKVLWRV